MKEPNNPSDRELRHLAPTSSMPGRNGGVLRRGNPGNRGNLRGRTTIKTIVRACRELEAELDRLRRLSDAGKLRAYDRIAYARLLFEIVKAGKGADEPPVGILVATGSPADLVASATRIEGVELVDGSQLEPPVIDAGTLESGDGAPRTDPRTASPPA